MNSDDLELVRGQVSSMGHQLKQLREKFDCLARWDVALVGRSDMEFHMGQLDKIQDRLDGLVHGAKS